MRKNLIFIIIVFSLIISAGMIKTKITTSSKVEDKSPSRDLIHSYIPHEPIEITNDGNFTDYGFPGIGTKNDPYIIDGYKIDMLGTPYEVGIYIYNTSKYFIIRNCSIETTVDSDNSNFCIRIERVGDGTVSITNNICSNSRRGIYMERSDSSSITNNRFENNSVGISLISSDYCMINNNTCNYNEIYGISLALSSSFCVLSYNTLLENSDYGIKTVGNSNNIIHHNKFISNGGESSQALDDIINYNNTWYEEGTQEGNYWSEWNKNKPYPIDGVANATDPYPLNENLERIDYEYTLVIPALILAAVLLKRKRNTYFGP